MMPMETALQLTIFIEECDTWHHRPLFAEIVHRAHEAGLAGATAFRGVEGFGASSVCTPLGCCPSSRTCRW